jgi:diguanylate cyclase (GGDEF)-like protein
MEDGKEREVEVFLHHAQGHRLPVMVRATALRDETGKIVGAIETFSNNTSVINTRRQLREMHQAAMTDPLTGIGNRRHLEGRIRAVIAEFQNIASHAGLLSIDVDHFKEFNDTYGHNTGDSVLRMVAQTMRHALRSTDTTGRWGGEEFIAIVHDVRDEDDLRSAAEKIRALVEHSRLDIDGQGLKVTVSIGGTLLCAEDTPESFVGRADQLMYRSKQGGRNCVTIG